MLVKRMYKAHKLNLVEKPIFDGQYLTFNGSQLVKQFKNSLTKNFPFLGN